MTKQGRIGKEGAEVSIHLHQQPLLYLNNFAPKMVSPEIHMSHSSFFVIVILIDTSLT